MKYSNIREEELKNRVAEDYFWQYDCNKIIGNVDFCVTFYQKKREMFDYESLLWAEAKSGKSDIYKSIVQLILTIGKARTFDKILPPAMLGAFDGEKIAFIPYNEIHNIFYINDFNWNVTPSNYETKEFSLILSLITQIITDKSLLFYFDKDDKELKKFIKNNFVVGRFGITKIRIDKNNFMVIYNKWLQTVKPTIAVNWEIAKKNGIIDGDFYLADLLSSENETLKEKLFVLLKKDHYELEKKLDEMGFFIVKRTFFTDGQMAHNQFWNKYERPPKEEYWDYIVERRDLLVPQDIRERKGSFFTPQIWVELSQKYLTDILGEDWQDEYYVWDCAAGTGNLLHGLTNKYNIWASTLDQQDVEVMKDRIRNGANLLEEHVFQFDFLNDDFSKLPKPLQKIINDPKKRKKLVIYINPPYAEAGSGVGRGFKTNVALEQKTNKIYKDKIGKAGNELFIQFLIKIYYEINGCIIAQFSKLKGISGSNSEIFRKNYLAKLKSLFVVPAYTFDNVKGNFPIGFFIWDTSIKEKFTKINAYIYDKHGVFIGNKNFYSFDDNKGRINDWLRTYFDKSSDQIGIMHNNKNDFQHNIQVRITILDIKDHTTPITRKNLIQMCIYFAVRHCIEPTWLNDRDQFLYPNDGWKEDREFQNDCLAFTLFHSQNRISSKEGTNHWIPFTEYEVGAKEKFDSDFMSKFIVGKFSQSQISDVMMFYGDSGGFSEERNTPLEFSPEAMAVFDAGRKLWIYYHAQPDCNVNASLYDIREHFQGRQENGKMNSKSNDEQYMQLITNLRDQLKILAKNIEPKIYKYGFLKL